MIMHLQRSNYSLSDTACGVPASLGRITKNKDEVTCRRCRVTDRYHATPRITTMTYTSGGNTIASVKLPELPPPSSYLTPREALDHFAGGARARFQVEITYPIENLGDLEAFFDDMCGWGDVRIYGAEYLKESGTSGEDGP